MSLGAVISKREINDYLNFGTVTGASQGRSHDQGSKNFKEALKQKYGIIQTKKTLLDMVTGTRLPHSIVIASHIFQYRWRMHLATFSTITDINDARNGLLLYKPVEWAFDRAKLCIEVKGGDMVFRLLDRGLENVKLTDKSPGFKEITRTPEIEAAEAQLVMTFGDLDGAKVQIPTDSEMRPSKRLLTLHAYASWLHAGPGSSIPPPPSSDVSGDHLTTELIQEALSWSKEKRRSHKITAMGGTY
jgi:hypothetical protein